MKKIRAEGMQFPMQSVSAIGTHLLKTFTFDSPKQLIVTETNEFSAVCPFSGLPDIAYVRIAYHPTGGVCVELKSLKYYMTSFRQVGIYQEGVTKRIYNDLRKLLRTSCLCVTTVYKTRGGFETSCVEGDINGVPK